MALCAQAGCATASPPGGGSADAEAELPGAVDAMHPPDARVESSWDAASTVDARAPLPDAAPGSPDAAASPDATGGGDLDPDLDLADPSGTVCTEPGAFYECPFFEVCRFYDSTSGRCETCWECGNLNATCTDGTQCDILFACYQGHCTNFCELGTHMCGPVEDCVDIGHPTWGVCRPY